MCIRDRGRRGRSGRSGSRRNYWKCRWQHHYLKDRRRNLYTECTDRPEGNKRRYQSWRRSRSNLLRWSGRSRWRSSSDPHCNSWCKRYRRSKEENFNRYSSRSWGRSYCSGYCRSGKYPVFFCRNRRNVWRYQRWWQGNSDLWWYTDR